MKLFSACKSADVFFFQYISGPFICFCLLCQILLSCASVSAGTSGRVVVSILPQKYFVEQIAGRHVQVTVMVPPGANPAIYEPRPSEMQAVSGARIYFSIGVPFERAWLPRFKTANPAMTIVDTRKGIKLYPVSKYGNGGRTGRKGILDPHIWLSPPLVITLARNMLVALIRVYPGYADDFRKNYRDFCSRVANLDISIMKILGTGLPKGVKTHGAFMVFHPSWGYFARAYGLKQISIEQEGKEPKPSQLVELIKTARKLGIRVILVQPQFSIKAARIVARATGARIIVADPLSYNWDRNLLQVARMLRSIPKAP